VNHFGPIIAAELRKRRPKPHAVWHLDEVYLKIDGRMVYLWRAVDAEGEVLDVLVQWLCHGNFILVSGTPGAGVRTQAAVAARHVRKASPRKTRSVRRDVRWRWTLKGLCHVAVPRVRSVDASGIVRPLRLPSATCPSPQREARGAFGLR